MRQVGPGESMFWTQDLCLMLICLCGIWINGHHLSVTYIDVRRVVRVSMRCVKEGV